LPENTPEAVDVATRTFERLEWRNIGPAYMSGRVADVEGVPGNPNLVYVASASGGLWKTTNGGTTWRPIFERQGTISIGDIALEPGNPDVIWVGTGESNVRNSVSFGDGVYRSTDGGNTWQNMGLRDTRYISKIVISPRDPNVVYVGALGHIFGPNEERGVFMTTDGGKTYTVNLNVPEIDDVIVGDGGVIAYVSFDNGVTFEALPEVFDGVAYGAYHQKSTLSIDLTDPYGQTAVTPPTGTVLIKVVILDATPLPS